MDEIEETKEAEEVLEILETKIFPILREVSRDYKYSTATLYAITITGINILESIATILAARDIEEARNFNEGIVKALHKRLNEVVTEAAQKYEQAR